MTSRTKSKAHYERKNRAEKGKLPVHILRDCPQKKLSYPSKRHAQNHAAKQNKAGLTSYPYRCPFCRLWHLTKQEPR